jgi:hypothetical protein
MRYSAGRCGAKRLASSAALLFAFAAALSGTATGAAPVPGDAAPAVGTPQAAQWVQRKIDFTYLGFTTHYSCEGLVDKVRTVLLVLGARKSDMNVHEAACTARVGEPVPFPTVTGTFYVLEPVGPAGVAPGQAEGASAAPGIVAARWEPVNVRFDYPGLDMSGQCELLEQVKQRILPLFPARNVQFQSLCVPHQLFSGGTSLKVEVLMPDKGASSTTHHGRDPAPATSELAQTR